MRKLLLLALAAVTVTFSASAARGDVNNDGEVSISDVNAIIDIILAS